MGYFIKKYLSGIMTGILFTFMILPYNISSQPRFYASIDSPEILAGNFFNLSFVLENGEGKNFIPPPFTQFDQVSGPSRLSSSSFINGVSSTKLSYSYSILINNPGEYTIQPASIRVGGKIYRTEELKIRVNETKKIDIASVGPDIRFFIRAELSNKTPYTGQQIMLQYKLYTRERIEGLRYELKPEFRDFKFEEIDIRFPEQRININGIDYTIYTINTISLFPLKKGSLTIPPAIYRIEIPDKNSGNIFFRSTIPHSVSTESITLEVKELPENVPDDFSDQVGKFKLSASISLNEQIIDEAFTILLDIETDAYPNTISAPDLRGKIEGFDIYDAKLAGNRQAFISGKLNTINTYEYVFVPKKEGNHYLSIPYTYFDTEMERYTTIFSDTIEIIVQSNSTTPQTTQFTKLDNTLKPSVADLNLRRIKKPFFNSLTYYSIIGIMISIVLVMYLIKLRNDKINKKDKNILIEIKAKKIAVKRLSNAKNLMSQRDKTAFISEIYNILTNFVSDKLSMKKSELTSGNINSRLFEAGVPQKIIEDYIQIIKDLEAAIYGISDHMDMDEIYKSSVQIIYYIEQNIKKPGK